MDRKSDRVTRAQRLARSQHVEATAFLHDIVATAEQLTTARAFDGSQPLRFDARWRLLRAIERSGGCPTFSDVARRLRITRQAARELILATEKVGLVELLRNPTDRRTLQVALSQDGRRTLEAHRLPEVAWLFTLLNGLEPTAMRSAARVLRVIRWRLERYEQEMSRAAWGRPRP